MEERRMGGGEVREDRWRRGVKHHEKKPSGVSTC